MKEVFKKLIIDFQEGEIKDVIPRDYSIPLDTNKIVSLIGVRRSGKTFMLYNLIHSIIKKNVSKNNIIYINFEDDRIFPLTLKDLDFLVQAYYELYPDKRNERVYFFLDEVQSVENWEIFIRRLYDTLNVSIFLTGSSSKLLSSEIATSLRGRTIVYEIFPFSFKEYLKYLKIHVDAYSSRSLSYIQNAFNTYIEDGGFAETFGQSDDLKKRILRDYRDLIIYKDIVERYNIKNQSLLKHLIKYFFVNMGTLVSFTRVYNEYKSLGYRVSKDALFEYLSYLQESFAIFLVPIFRNSVREEQRNPRKIYVIDNGFRKLYDVSLSNDYSKLYENMAFLHLRRYTDEVYYFKDKHEVDFYLNINGGMLVNVCYDIENKATFSRELNALREGMNYFKLDSSYLITSHREEAINLDNKTIYVIPMWKWLLEDVGERGRER